MKRRLFLILFSMLISGNVFCQERELYVELVPEKNLLDKGEIFTVVTSITNMAMNEQKICFWNCSYDGNWILQDSTGSVHFYGQDCDKNFVTCKVLGPLEKFEKELYLQVSDEAKSGVTSFRLGFMPCLNKEDCFETANKNPDTFFGQETTVRIK